MRSGAHVRWRWDTAESRPSPRLGVLVRMGRLLGDGWMRSDPACNRMKARHGHHAPPRVRQRRSSPREAVKAEVPT
jgi:hypothetical protein